MIRLGHVHLYGLWLHFFTSLYENLLLGAIKLTSVLLLRHIVLKIIVIFILHEVVALSQAAVDFHIVVNRVVLGVLTGKVAYGSLC